MISLTVLAAASTTKVRERSSSFVGIDATPYGLASGKSGAKSSWCRAVKR